MFQSHPTGCSNRKDHRDERLSQTVHRYAREIQAGSRGSTGPLTTRRNDNSIESATDAVNYSPCARSLLGLNRLQSNSDIMQAKCRQIRNNTLRIEHVSPLRRRTPAQVMERKSFRQVLDCGSPLPLCKTRRSAGCSVSSGTSPTFNHSPLRSFLKTMLEVLRRIA